MTSVKDKVLTKPMVEVAENNIWHSARYLFPVISHNISGTLKPFVVIKQYIRNQIYDLS
jgi:hypothetical protein